MAEDSSEPSRSRALAHVIDTYGSDHEEEYDSPLVVALLKSAFILVPLVVSLGLGVVAAFTSGILFWGSLGLAMLLACRPAHHPIERPALRPLSVAVVRTQDDLD